MAANQGQKTTGSGIAPSNADINKNWDRIALESQLQVAEQNLAISESGRKLAVEQLGMMERSRTHLHDVVIPQIRAREEAWSERWVKAMEQRDRVIQMLKDADRVCTKDGHEWGWQLFARDLVAQIEAADQPEK